MAKKSPAKVKKGPGGRPSTYKPEYCKKVIEHCSEGLSFDSFAGLCGTTIETVHNWARLNPEFAEAKKEAEAKSLIWWERTGIHGLMLEKGMTFNAAVYIFNMKNRFRWSDRTDLKITGDFQDKKDEHEILRAVDRRKLIALARQEEKAG